MSKSMLTSFSPSLFPDEESCVLGLLEDLPWDDKRAARVADMASGWAERVRSKPKSLGQLEQFLQQFSLTSDEGLALMTLSEALLRIPDNATMNALIQDKMHAADWAAIGKASSGSSALMKVAGVGLKASAKVLDHAMGRLGQPVIREAMMQVMRSMGKQFVLGEDIQEAFVNALPHEKKGFRMSYDMLGEAARTSDDAEFYFKAYRDAIRSVGHRLHAGLPGAHEARDVPGVSVKLSALYPRYELSQQERCIPAMVDRLLMLAKEAARYNIAMTVDAEEVDRLPLSLEIIEGVLKSGELPEWDGFGLAVQAYHKRALGVIDWAVDKASDYNRRMQVRLVKGAYWDYEIKRAQEMGLPDFPVFTRKCHSDVSYLTCAAAMLQQSDMIYPMFGTHNAHSIAAVMDMAAEYDAPFEFQCLYGMGQGIYSALKRDHDVAISLYAPVGPHKDLLPYLVRRILENGANSSFVNQLLDKDHEVAMLVRDPVAQASEGGYQPHSLIQNAADLFEDEESGARSNSRGLDFDSGAVVKTLYEAIEPYHTKSFEAASVIGGKLYKDDMAELRFNPADQAETVGKVWYAKQRIVKDAMEVAEDGYKAWSQTDSIIRAAMLDDVADLIEENAAVLMALLVREAGKTLHDAHLEIREAVDFCRYYAAQGRIDCDSKGIELPGPTGESNVYYRHGRGIFVCISPWNFPLAIFAGQIAAALMAGNAVVAKPAEQTPLIASMMVDLFYQGGIPQDALNLVVGDGFIGAALVDHPSVAGVAFTGSTSVARNIQQALSVKQNGIVPLIAETGGQNVMIVDSSALAEQVVDDVIKSAFGSAGQRCSALRILCVQEDIADSVVNLLRGAMQQLSVGDPWQIASDIGPIIDAEARSGLRKHRDSLDGFGRVIHRINLAEDMTSRGFFMGPCAYEIDQLSALEEEAFGPILHVYRYARKDLDDMIGEINAMGYGLTFGIHSRIESFIADVARKVRAGNVYVNRGMTGAVVGSQPFGGHGLSGTGPKAGGPDYLRRFCAERVVSKDTTASGGNASLVSLEE